MKRLRRKIANFSMRRVREKLRRALIDWLDCAPREELKKLDARTDRQAAHARRLADLQSRSIEWLARTQASQSTDAPERSALAAGPLVSIVMPCRNRAARIGAAIDSVRAQEWTRWELLIVDDGSTDDLAAALEPYANDSRIRLLRQEHLGVCAARNHGLERTAGEIIAYLDSDNEWFPNYLSNVVAAFDGRPERECVYLAQLFHDRRLKASWIQSIGFDRDTFAREGRIDLNTFSHRRSVYEREGGFDLELRRLVDWELIGRYTRTTPPVSVPRVSGIYYVAEPDSISARESFAYNAHLVQRKLLRPIPRPLRVLYVTGGHPQRSETYIRTEIVDMLRRGVEIEVWSKDPAPSSPYPSEVPVHVGPLEQAIDAFAPDLLHAHWLHVAAESAPLAADRGLPLTVRGHGFEYSPELFRELVRLDAISAVFAFPHQVAGIESDKVFALPAVFGGDWYPPSERKDPRLVLRCGAMLPTKDLLTFVEAAAQCPDHRFVLAGVTVKGQDDVRRQIESRNRALGSPVEIRRDLPWNEMYALMAEAGIYLHTCGPQYPFGMPISIAEAMATGAFAMTRQSAAASAFLGDAGATYQDLPQAVSLVRSTAKWSDEDWQARRTQAVEHAYANHSDVKYLHLVADVWCRLVDTKDVEMRRAA